jgi:hypothetical protein
LVSKEEAASGGKRGLKGAMMNEKDGKHVDNSIIIIEEYPITDLSWI